MSFEEAMPHTSRKAKKRELSFVRERSFPTGAAATDSFSSSSHAYYVSDSPASHGGDYPPSASSSGSGVAS
eukprot:2010436-Amphidinium_carterae.1